MSKRKRAREDEDILRDLLADSPGIKHHKRSFVITCGNFRVVIVHRGGTIEQIRCLERTPDGEGYHYADSTLEDIMKYRYWSWTKHNRSAWPPLRVVCELTDDAPHFTAEGTAKLNDDIDSDWYRSVIKKMLNLKDGNEETP